MGRVGKTKDLTLDSLSGKINKIDQRTLDKDLET